MKRVEGKVALITGAASGLGKAEAILLAREGAKVIVTDVNDEAGRKLAQEIDGAFIHHDVRSEDDWRRAIAFAVERYGKLDVLVNNAGIVVIADIETTSLEQYRLIHAIHSEGTFLGCKHGIEAMKKQGGSIINTASLSALRAYPPVVAYASAKGAIRSLSMTVAAHCQDKGYPIRSNVIFPGNIDTPLLEGAMGMKPPPGTGQPEDVANAVLYLASDESRFITGAEFVIDNGVSIRPGA
ncbi:SDR family oxidoreductase [Noviherbaspirillum sedimenti]|uniref:SDR family oxidoreductase n=1 Tax=Noviherbaspirillum sedimenti TaxID=2320865 RepID=A0A3A3G5V1_9BURK|nr:SDR family oxidoreductase [Noviherbaspirillum sedimenti]RJG03194.1 SDR family oxidoreductase [Noviherbaspirillum sedimenti]